MRQTIASNIKRFRLEKGLTQEKLAFDLGISSEYVSRLEHGIKQPSIPLLEQIANLTGRQLSDFFAPPQQYTEE